MTGIRLWIEVADRRELESARAGGSADTFVLSATGSPVYGRPGDRLAVRLSDDLLPDRLGPSISRLPLRAGVIVSWTPSGRAVLTELAARQRDPLAVVVSRPSEAGEAARAGATNVVVESVGDLAAIVAEIGQQHIGVVARVGTVGDAEVAVAAGASGLLVPAGLVDALLATPALAIGFAPTPRPVRESSPTMGPRPATIGGTLDRAARRFAGRDALVHVARSTRLSYAELRTEVRTVGRAMLALGVQPGDRVALWARNVPEWPVVQLATAYIGAVLVTVNPSLTDDELGFVLSNSGAGLLLAAPRSPEQAELAGRAARAGAPHELRHVILLPSSIQSAASMSGPGLSWASFRALASRIPDRELDRMAARPQPDDVVNLLYTSGTTGVPKGAMLTHRGMLQNAAAVGGNLRLGPDDRLCLAVPFHHCFGSVMGTLATITFGAALVIPDDWFEAGSVLHAVEAERCTVLYGVPTMFLAELEHPDRASTDLRSLRSGIMAGAPVPPELAARAASELHLPGLVVAYGLTEASPVVTQTAPTDEPDIRLGSVGRPVIGAELRIADPVTGIPVTAGAVGEVQTRGPMVMRGYFDLEEETQSVIDRSGWLHTGDLGTQSADGVVHIVGRIKDMIIRGGENVYPAEIEAVGRRHPGVADIQVVGVPSERLGEEIVAFVRSSPGSTVSIEALSAHLAGHLAPFKVPSRIHLVESYPTTGSGKVQKHRLREEAVRLAGGSPDSGRANGEPTAIGAGRAPALPLLPAKAMRPLSGPPAPVGSNPTPDADRSAPADPPAPSRPPRPGWRRPASQGWARTSDRRITTSEPAGEPTTMTLDDTRRRGQRIKTWGIGGDIRGQIEATGELPIMYRALGTPPQTRHPFNLYGDIRSQPDALRGTFETAHEIAEVARRLAERDPIGAIGLGSGTSQFVAQVADAAYARFADLPGWDYDSLHFLRYTPPIDFRRYAVMAYSGSGSTVDTVAAAKQSRAAGAFTLAFTSIEGSPVVQASDARILTAGGFDTGGSDTFHYTTRIAAAIYLALELGKIRRPGAHDYDGLIQELRSTATRMGEIFDTVDARCRTIAERFMDVRSILVVGAGANYGTAEEIALKFDEMAHLPTKPMNPGRHIHGALGLTEESILTILVAPPGPSYQDMVSLAKVTEMLKTPSVAIVTEDDTEVADRCDYVIRLPIRDETIFAVLAVLPGQLLPYWCGVGLGLNPDTQRSNVPKHAKVWNMLFPPGTH